METDKFCPRCGTDYQWTSNYKWTHDSELEES